jgi:hypothetical protein
MSDPQWKFLEEVFLSNSISAALGHSSTYKKQNLTEQERRKRSEILGEALKHDLCEVVAKHYSSRPVNPKHHAQHIGAIARHLSRKHTALLDNGRFRFGTAQKALNLYLKFLWCADRIPMPPDCPVDAKVLGKLPLSSPLKAIKWTQIKDKATYCNLVSMARIVAGNEPLAEWELRVWPATGCSAWVTSTSQN